MMSQRMKQADGSHGWDDDKERSHNNKEKPKRNSTKKHRLYTKEKSNKIPLQVVVLGW